MSTPSTVKRRLRGITRQGAANDRPISRYCARFGGRSVAGHGRRCRSKRTIADIAKSGCRVARGLCSDCSSSCPARRSGRSNINVAEITARANRDVGVNIETAIKGWQTELDRVESALQKPRLRYSELNDLRDELQSLRAGTEDFSKRLEPPLAAAKDRAALLGPAPAAGQPARAGTSCPQSGRAQLPLRAAIGGSSCGPLCQSADRPAHQYHPGHSPKEFCYQPVPARPGHLLVPDLGKVAGLRAFGDEPRSRHRDRFPRS